MSSKSLTKYEYPEPLETTYIKLSEESLWVAFKSKSRWSKGWGSSSSTLITKESISFMIRWGCWNKSPSQSCTLQPIDGGQWVPVLSLVQRIHHELWSQVLDFCVWRICRSFKVMFQMTIQQLYSYGIHIKEINIKINSQKLVVLEDRTRLDKNVPLGVMFKYHLYRFYSLFWISLVPCSSPQRCSPSLNGKPMYILFHTPHSW